jgi:hypothetical protein
MLDPLAIALQGVGFGPAVFALQGFVEDDEAQGEPGLTAAWVPAPERKKKRKRRDTDDDAIFLFLLS